MKKIPAATSRLQEKNQKQGCLIRLRCLQLTHHSSAELLVLGDFQSLSVRSQCVATIPSDVR
jgi:hypothetical protein